MSRNPQNDRHVGRPSGFRRRWYDQIPNVGVAIELTARLPEFLQRSIVHSLNDYIDHYRKVSKHKGLSVGANKVMGLYTASYRNRWYDPDPQMRRAFNMMATVPPGVLGQFSAQVVNIGKIIVAQGVGVVEADPIGFLTEVNTILSKTYETLTDDGRGLKLENVRPVGTEESVEGKMVYPAKTIRVRRQIP